MCDIIMNHTNITIVLQFFFNFITTIIFLLFIYYYYLGFFWCLWHFRKIKNNLKLIDPVY